MSSLSEIDALKQYLERRDTDYAYMITGEWGCGKTYFWKNNVIPLLNNGINWKQEIKPVPVYISMYGIKDLDEISKMIVAQANPLLHKMSSSSTAITKASIDILNHFTGIDFSEKKKQGEKALKWFLKRLENKEVVLCIDDLERCIFKPHEVFGVLNEYIEHMGLKLVILCNEKELLKKYTDGKRGQYYDAKEKLVRITRKFKSQADEIAKTFIEEFSIDKDFHKFLSNNSKLIDSHFTASKYKNLRHLKYAFQVTYDLYCAFRNIQLDNKLWVDKLISTVLPTAFELQKGKISSNDAYKILLQGSGIMVANALKNKTKRKQNTYKLGRFLEKYELDFLLKPILQSRAIATRLVHGVTDIDLLKSEFDSKDNKTSKNHQQAIYFSGNYYRLKDNEFDEVVKATIDCLADGEITDWDLLFRIISSAEGCLHYGFFTDINQFKAALAKGIEKQLINKQFETRDDIYIYHSKHSISQDKPDDFWAFKLLNEANNKALMEKHLICIETTIEELENDPENFRIMLSSHQKDTLYRYPVSKFINVDKLYLKIANSSPETRHTISYTIQKRYENNPYISALFDDNAWLKQLKDKLDFLISNSRMDLPSGKWLSKIAENISIALTKLSKSP